MYVCTCAVAVFICKCVRNCVFSYSINIYLQWRNTETEFMTNGNESNAFLFETI